MGEDQPDLVRQVSVLDHDAIPKVRSFIAYHRCNIVVTDRLTDKRTHRQRLKSGNAYMFWCI